MGTCMYIILIYINIYIRLAEISIYIYIYIFLFLYIYICFCEFIFFGQVSVGLAFVRSVFVLIVALLYEFFKGANEVRIKANLRGMQMN